jgi:hypothetical protein
VKVIYPLLALGFLLGGCSATISDSKIQQKLVGAWKSGDSGITYYPDGIWVEKMSPLDTNDSRSINLIFDGTWKVKDGVLIKDTSWMTQARYKDSWFDVEHLKVIRVDKNALILSPSGQTNLFTWKKL